VVVVPLILYSDQTHISSSGRRKAWPLTMTIANIPREGRWKPKAHDVLGFLSEPTGVENFVKVKTFQLQLQHILAPLIEASKT
jgi:Plavaka transposase